MGVWEPWMPALGQRVRIRISAECQSRAYNASPPPTVSDDEMREMLRARVDVANRFARDEWIVGHPEEVDGVEGTVTDINRALDFGHYYRVMFDRATGPGMILSMDMAAIELEPLDTSIAMTDACRVYWGSHGCALDRGHAGEHECDCCDCPEGRHNGTESPTLIDDDAVVCVAKAPYYGPDETVFYGEDA